LPEPKRIIFLYSELANYFLVCIDELRQKINCKIHIIHWPINSEAPFKLDLQIENVIFYDRKNYDLSKLQNLIHEIDPHLIYCSGWIDNDYTQIAKKYRSRIPVVSGLDTQWNGSFKQQIHSLISPFTVKKYFSHLWIAGEPQVKYAQKLGFNSSNILKGVYSADVPFFNSVYLNAAPKKSLSLPKRFIFVGRYLEFKGIFDLWNAFIKTFDILDHDWELWCLGTGALWDKRMMHPKIRHLGFVQPNEMPAIMDQTSVFVLPSHFEPWAVALHEFAAAGFPLISSNKVGANTAFLKDGQNGFIFPSGNVEELTNAFMKFIQMSPQELLQYGQTSNALSKTITPATWASTVASLV